ncbi:MAG: protein kinase [Synechococcales cyanobacterium C42_A2020_086]|jgi:hypothetical protein|nr:protein kinase [Synechococcales cyanobacterium C42_A2020_086]
MVNFGTAPDGLPWITQVEALPKGAAMLAVAEQAFSLRGTSPDFAGTPLHDIALSLDKLIQQHYSQDIRTPDGSAFHATILPRPLKLLLGDTLLHRFLVSGAAPRTQFKTSPLGAATNAVTTEETAVVQFQIGDACLAFPDQGGRLSIVHMTHDQFGWPTFTFRRPFIQETVTALPGGLLCLFDSAKVVAELPASDLKSYLDRRGDSLHADWRIRVPRESLGQIILGIARTAQRLHSADEIHGDIKPANVLVDGDDVQLIDSLSLHEGERSPALTRGWAAPEQVMATEVTASTDQFPIGLMLLALVQGVLFGEETTVVVPSGGSKIERHVIFRSPGVFIDPNMGTVNESYIHAWQKMIEKCLRFSPSDRFPAVGDLVGELDSLLVAKSLYGWCECALRFGRASSAISSNGKEVSVWLSG